MTLTDPREELAEQSSFIGYLMGLAGLAQLVRALAACDGGPRPEPRPHTEDADDFVYALLGVASLGQQIERLAESAAAQQRCAAVTPAPASANRRWLR
ncbi:hypothetical protein [Mycolicibacterium sp. 624]|jgi:hypothetical protein|uniref:hypothetical protein n=1 Tax=Mycolicibacterium sp. 624 TaxID=3156314 RepID=UPI003398C0C2